MKRAPALAVLDFAQIAAGLDATDAMLKKAPVAFFRSGSVTRGRYLTLLGGTPASVAEALAEGLARAGGQVLDHLFLADVHPRLLDALSRMAKECDASIFVKNGRSQAGLGLDGEGSCSFTIASPTGEGLTGPRSFSRWRRCVLVDNFRIT